MVSASADGGGVVAKDKRGIAQEYGARAESASVASATEKAPSTLKADAPHATSAHTTVHAA